MRHTSSLARLLSGRPALTAHPPERSPSRPDVSSSLWRACLAEGSTLLKVLLSGIVVWLTTPASAGILKGQAVLSQPYPLPEGAVLDVQLLAAVGPADGRTVLVGRSRQAVSSRSPLDFELPFLDAAIQPNGRYLLRASLHQADRLLFRTNRAIPVFPGKQGAMRLEMEAIGDAPLRGLVWLRTPAASVPTPPGAPRQEQQFQLDPFNRSLTGSGDCNRFTGSYTLEKDKLQLLPVVSTMLECEPEVSIDESAFLQALRAVQRWRLDSRGRLELLDQNEAPLLLMETRPL